MEKMAVISINAKLTINDYSGLNLTETIKAGVTINKNDIIIEYNNGAISYPKELFEKIANYYQRIKCVIE